MKRRSSLFVVLSVVLSLLTFAMPVANAASSVNNASSVVNTNTSLDNAIQGLFAVRANAAMGEQAPELSSYYLANSALLNNELTRPEHFRQLEKRWNTHIIDIKPTATIVDCSVYGNVANVDVYEKTFFDWTEGNKVITSGYGVPHRMTWENIDSSWKVTFDSYDESELLGVTSPDYVPPATNSQIAPQPSKETPKQASPQYYAYYTYYRSTAAQYADTYWSNYNPNYPNYNNSGGDCANFVSQSVHAGNAPPVNMDINNQYSWWFDATKWTSSQT